MSSADSKLHTEMPCFELALTQVIKQVSPPSSVDMESARGTTNEKEAKAEATEEEPSSFQPEYFKNERQYHLSCLGLIIGFGNFLRFPYILATYGGAVFLIPYFVVLFGVGVPILCLEIAFGQTIKVRLMDKFSMIHPTFWGFSLAVLWINFWCLSYYVMPLVYSARFFLSSFETPLPWAKEGSPWNEHYFADHVLQKSGSDLSRPVQFVPSLVVLLFAVYAALYFVIRKGILSSTQVAQITVSLPYFIMLTLLMKGLTLPGADIGLKFLFVPNWSCLMDLEIWKQAFVQVVYSSGVIFQIIMFYSRSREEHQSVVKAAFTFAGINSATSIMASITLFCFLGHVSKLMQIEIKDLNIQGYDLAFIGYPGLMTTLASPNLWSLLFFAMFFMVGVDSMFGMQDLVLGYAWEFSCSVKWKASKEQVALALIVLSFVSGIIFTTSNGWWWFSLFNRYCTGDNLLFMAIVECSILVYGLGLDKLEALMRKKTNESFPSYIKASLKYVCVPVFSAVLTFSIHKEIMCEAHSAWMYWFGRSLAVAPILLVIVGFVSPAKQTIKIENYIERT